MSINLIEALKDLLNDNVLSKAADMVGGNTVAVEKGITLASGAIIAAAAEKTANPEDSQRLFNMLGDGEVLNSLETQISEGSGLLNSGMTIVDTLLGAKSSATVSHIATETGLGHGAATSLLSIAGGLVGGLLGKQKNLLGSASALSNLLSSQNSLVARLFPSLGGALGFAALSLSDIGDKLSGVGGAAVDTVGKGVDALGDGAEAVGDMAAKVGGAAVDTVGKGVDALGDGAEAIGDMAAKVGGAAVDTVGKGVDALGDGAEAIGDMAAKVGGAAVDTVGKGVDALGDGAEAIGDMAAKVGGAAVDTVGKGVDALGDGAEAIGDMAAKVGGTAVDTVGKGVDALGDGVEAVGDMAEKVGGAALDLGSNALQGSKSLLGKLLPWGVFAVAIVALFAVLKTCSPSDTISNIAETTSEAASNMTNAATDIASDTAQGAVGLTNDAIRATGDAAQATINAADETVKAGAELADAAVTASGDAIVGAAEITGDAIDATGNAVTAVADATVGAVKKTEAILNSFGEAVGEFFNFELPGGTKINIPKGGLEESFLNALADKNVTSSFIFDRLYFATGSDTLNEESQEQIANVAAILTAYPDMNIMLRGHTDSTGSEAANLILSKQRADAVKAALTNLDIAGSRISTQGLASREPIADDTTDSGRQRNRRIDVSIVK